MALICISFSILYFIFAGGYSAFKSTLSKADNSATKINDEVANAKITTPDDDGFVRSSV